MKAPMVKPPTAGEAEKSIEADTARNEVSLSLAVAAVQHRGERNARVGCGTPPAVQMHADVELVDLLEELCARQRVEAHLDADLGEHAGDRGADALVVHVA